MIGLALNFGRLAYARPGYGYPALEDPFAGCLLPEDDGVEIVDLVSGRGNLVFSMRDFAAHLAEDKQADFHYLNAASLSPDAQQFSILYKRAASISEPGIWEVDAFIGATDGTRLVRVPLPGRASHYWWLDETKIAYTVVSQGGCSYVVFDVNEGSVRPLNAASPKVDGHPSLHHGTGRWITDSYPDIYGEQVLRVLEPDDTDRVIGRFKSDPRYRDDFRCDLHPRWSSDGRSVIIDSTHEGSRAVYVVEVED